MKNILKYGVVPLVVGAFLLCVTLMLLPVLINVQKFLPQIEKQVAQSTGRPFSVGSDFGLTFFPWLSVTFSDMQFGNPKGVVGDDFIGVDSLEARVKLLPLLANKVEISRFVVSGLHVNLQREKNGKANWQMLSAKEGSSRLSSFFTRDLSIELLAITGGSLTFTDQEKDEKHILKDLMLVVNNVSSHDKAKVDFKALADGHQLVGAGAIGPVSSNLNSLFIDLRLQLNENLQTFVKGDCSYPLESTTCDLNVKIPRFSLVDIYNHSDGTAKGQQLGPLVELVGQFVGDAHKFTVNSGTGLIDDTHFTYQLVHDSETEKVNQFDLNLTKFDIDHYFAGKTSDGRDAASEESLPVLNALKQWPFFGRLRADELTFSGIKVSNVKTLVTANNGMLEFTEGTFNLHEGKGTFDATLGFDNKADAFESNIEFLEVQMEPLTKQTIGASLLSGAMNGSINIKRSAVKGNAEGKVLAWKGTIQIDDGTIFGLHLVAADNTEDDYNTEFSLLSADLIMEEGVVYLKPLTLVGATGSAVMSGVIQLDDKSFTITPEVEEDGEDVLSLAGSYGPEGIAVDGYTDVHETKLLEPRDAQTLVDAKMPVPVDDDIAGVVGTPLIDPAIVAQRFGLKPDLIKQEKAKKAYNVGRGRVIIHDLKVLDSSVFAQ